MVVMTAMVVVGAVLTYDEHACATPTTSRRRGRCISPRWPISSWQASSCGSAVASFGAALALGLVMRALFAEERRQRRRDLYTADAPERPRASSRRRHERARLRSVATWAVRSAVGAPAVLAVVAFACGVLALTPFAARRRARRPRAAQARPRRLERALGGAGPLAVPLFVRVVSRSAMRRAFRGERPSLHGVGALAADFYLETGRMPLASPREQPTRTRPAFPPGEIRALVAFVASFGGPTIPTR